jgi:uncharacterized metal-binding protein YceD (DUF177 family)
MKIYIDRLKGGQVEKIDLVLDKELLQVEEKELIFSQKISVIGEAYLTDDHLLVQLNIDTMVQVPCSICNKLIETPLIVKEFTHTEILDRRTSIYDCLPLLREAVLLQVPAFIECSKGTCPERSTVNKFLKTMNSPSSFPFADLK